MNCVVDLLDRWVAAGRGNRPCLISPAERWTYAQLAERVNRIANVLTRTLGVSPGHRVLLRGPNNPMMVAAYLAVIKAGGIVVATMPLLRAKEIAYPIGKAKIHLALCDHRLADEMEKARALAPDLERVIYWGGGGADALETLMATPGCESLVPCDTASDDVCLIAFTFGLGGLVLFPLRVGAASVLIEKASPDDLLAAIEKLRATIAFTAPTAYRAMLAKLREHDVSSLRKCVSAGEALPKATFDAWLAATGIKILDGIGATEMLHIFIGSPEEEIRPGATGKPVPGYEARVVDAEGKELPPNRIGRLAVRGPTGCRYLADKRQRQYVQNGWNVTGDTYLMDADGYFWYQARSDDMIVSAGYNIAGPEVEAALL